MVSLSLKKTLKIFTGKTITAKVLRALFFKSNIAITYSLIPSVTSVYLILILDDILPFAVT